MNEQNNEGPLTAKERAQNAILAYEEECIEIITSNRAIVLHKDPAFNQYRLLFDAIDLCVVYDLDITLLRNQVKCAETKWRANLNARLLAMTIWECVDDLPAIFGREVRGALADLTISHNLRTELDETLRDINIFKRTHGSSLKAIRDFTAAHRDQRVDRLLAALQEVRPMDVVDLARSLRLLLQALHKTMITVLREAKQLIPFWHATRSFKPS
jgi:hypothetical protein